MASSVKNNVRDLNFQLGYISAQAFIKYELPTLSTDRLKSRNVIEVSKELTKEWGSRRKNKNYEFYESLEWYKENIEKVYLPKEIVAVIEEVYPEDFELFKEGFELALWNCDYSHYSYGEFLFNNDMEWCSRIKLKYEK